MIFRLFRRKKPAAPDVAETAASGFANFVKKLTTHSDADVGDLPDVATIPFALLSVSLAVRVLLNVSMALHRFVPLSWATHHPSGKKSFEPQTKHQVNICGKKSLRSRPLMLLKKKRVLDDDDASSVSSGSVSFASLNTKTMSLSMNGDEEAATMMENIERREMATSPIPDLQEFEYWKQFATLSPDPPTSPRDAFIPRLDLPNEIDPSPFATIEPEIGTTISEKVATELELMEKGKNQSGLTIHDSAMTRSKLPEIKEDKEMFALQKQAQQVKEEEVERCVSPCSSLHSAYSDSVAAKYVNWNYCNPQHFEESMEMTPRTPLGGSIRHRYALRRMQSMLSRRSTMSPRFDEYNPTPRRMMKSPSIMSRRSQSRPISRKMSFRSIDESIPEVSEAYSCIRLETCIRKAWQLSTLNYTENGGCEEANGNSGAMRSELKSMKRQMSKRKEESNDIGEDGGCKGEQVLSFVRVPLEAADGMFTSRKEVLCNPYFGADAMTMDDQVSVGDAAADDDGNSVLDTSSVAMRTPLQKIGHTPKEICGLCEKNLDEGTYDNPLEVCSFRSYDSDTELGLTSFRDRNPISKLLALDHIRGISKDGIPLSEIEGDEYGSAVLGGVGNCPIRDSILDKYLTQLVINDAIDNGKDVEKISEDNGLSSSKVTSVQHKSAPEELDTALRYCLMERFLLDNIFYEMDVNLEAMELARIKQKTSKNSSSRRLRRS